MDLGPGIGDVCSQNIDGLDVRLYIPVLNRKGTYNDIMSGSIGSVLEIKTDEMFGQTPVAHLIDLVEDQVQKIKSRDKRRREINVGRNG